MGLKTDIKEYSFYNIVRGWATSLFIGIPLLYLAFMLPFTWGKLVLVYNPEWYARGIMGGLGILAMLAPNKLPSVIIDAFDFAKSMIGKK